MKKTEKKSNMMPSLVSPDSHASIMPFAVGTFLITLLFFAYYVSTWRNFFNFQAAIDTCAKPFCDFATFYYPMGEAVFHMRLPLEGFVYSPFIAILMAVFPPFGLHTALALWGILQAISIILFLLLFRQLVPARLPIQLFFVALALSSFPLLHNLAWGQVGIITTVTILGALFFYERGQYIAAVVLLTFGLSFKFFPLIFFVPFIIRRDIRFLLLGAATCITFLFVVPAILLGVDDTLRFYFSLFDAYRNFDWVIKNYNSQHFPHVFLRLAKALGYNAYIDLPLLTWISYGIAVANMGLLFLVQHTRLHLANLWSFHIIFLTIPFVLMTSWPVDLVYISFAQGLLAWQLVEEKKRTPAMRYAIFFLLIASIIISSIIFFNFIGDSHIFGFSGAIFWTDLLLLATSYMVLLPPVFRKVRKK